MREDVEWLYTEDEGERRERVAESLAAQPKPNAPQEYDVLEAEFWRTRHVPAGSVLTYSLADETLAPAGLIAVLVKTRQSKQEGIWLEVKALGCAEAAFKHRLQGCYKGARKFHHICYPDAEGNCPQAGSQGIHLMKFKWYPPGDFDAEWLSKASRKAILEGIDMAATEREGEPPPGRRHPGPVGNDTSKVEEQLRKLRDKGRTRVTFVGEGGELPSAVPDGGPGGALRAGILRKPVESSSAVALSPRTQKVKEEVIPVDSDTEVAPKEKKRGLRKKRGKGVGETLALAVASRQTLTSQQTGKKRRSRSRSSQRDKKKKKKRRSSSQDSSQEGSSEDSSSLSLQPPLKKKSMKEPGSVYRLLVAQAAEQLAQEGLEQDESTGLRGAGSKVKMYTYYQLALKPSLDARSRDAKELAMLAKALDLLQEGDLAQLADLISARLIAVDTATRQGWQAARYLEIQSLEDDGTAPPHILLAAMRHQKQVEKAGGKGSWSRSQSWQWDWQSDARPKGKGKDQKGKGKKGKPKGKGGKQGWSHWQGSPKEKTGEAAPKPDS